MENTETVTITRAEYEQLIATKSEVAYLKFQLDELKRLIFGASSERHITPAADQPTLFEVPAQEKGEAAKEQITCFRKSG